MARFRFSWAALRALSAILSLSWALFLVDKATLYSLVAVYRLAVALVTAKVATATTRFNELTIALFLSTKSRTSNN